MVSWAGSAVAGFEQRFPDVLARPGVETRVLVPWQPQVAAWLADLEDPVTHERYAVRTIKTRELERFRGWVTDWEFSECAERL